MREVLIGFDSAWTDSSSNPGTIAGCVFEDGRPNSFHAPRLATFGAALDLIREWSIDADFVLIAIDQPTIVPNHEGCRPVDRVAGSLISRLGGGVQPARRGGLGAPLFGNEAPIWRFLAELDGIQNPFQARQSPTGCFVMEVFPALSLPAIVPALWQRGKGAKYNPAGRKFDPLDWPIVLSGVAAFARGLGADDLARWTESCQFHSAPKKADQDRLDAAICLAIALAWRHGESNDLLVIGDDRTGYIATIASRETRAALTKAAVERHVAVDQTWLGNLNSFAQHSGKSNHPDTSLNLKRPATVDPSELRAMLIDVARTGSPIAYGEVANRFGHKWSLVFSTSLARALDAVAIENERLGEPLLACLVVSRETGCPGQGFYNKFRDGETDPAAQREILETEVERCQMWQWRTDAHADPRP